VGDINITDKSVGTPGTSGGIVVVVVVDVVVDVDVDVVSSATVVVVGAGSANTRVVGEMSALPRTTNKATNSPV
jgi:hypothetical protein